MLARFAKNKMDVVLSESLYYVCLFISYVVCFAISINFTDAGTALLFALVCGDILGFVLLLAVVLVQACLTNRN